MSTADRIAWATRIATDAHRGQVRTDPRGDLPYIVHPLRVAALVGAHGGSPEAVAAAILHDVLEDTPVTGDGWPADILAMVRGCTKRPDQDRLSCLANLREAPPEAILVKLADRYDNLTAEADGPAYGRKKLVRESSIALVALACDCGVGSALADAIHGLTDNPPLPLTEPVTCPYCQWTGLPMNACLEGQMPRISVWCPTCAAHVPMESLGWILSAPSVVANAQHDISYRNSQP